MFKHPSRNRRFLIARAASKLTYANVVATLALFIALGGVSWAAVTLPKNSVGSKQIRKNAVSHSKVKDRSLTGKDLKNDSVTGAQIDESSLNIVPAAATAQAASSISDRFSIVKRVSISSSTTPVSQARTEAAEIALASHGAISLYAKCFKLSVNSSVYGELIVRSSVDGAFGNASLSLSDFMTNPPLGPAIVEEQRVIARVTATVGIAQKGGGGGVFLSPDGIGLSAGATISTISSALNPALTYASPESCIFVVEGTRLG